MAISYPAGLDALTNPIATDPQNNPSHSTQHANANDILEAIETKVGIDSSAVTTSLDYLLKNSASINPGHLHNSLSALDGNPAQAVYVDASGNVGIGTVTPSTPFDVYGKSSFKSTASSIVLGNEILTNGTFDTDLSDWNINLGDWVWDSGHALSPAGTANLSRNVTLEGGALYQISFAFYANGGNVDVRVASTTIGSGLTAGSTLFYLNSSPGTKPLTFIPHSFNNSWLDTISLKKVTPSDPAIIVKNTDGTTGFEIRTGSGTTNVGIGSGTLQNNSGVDNVGIGYYCLAKNATGTDNTAIGYSALSGSYTGIRNTAIGSLALGYLTSGSYNVAIGRAALGGATATTCSNNVAVGYTAGDSCSTGTYNVAIGDNADFAAGTDTNSIVIGSSAVGLGSNSVVLGNTSIVKTSLNGSVGINTTSPTARLHLPAGTATASTAPLKFTSGTLLTAPEAGAVEFLTDDFYATITTGAARKKFALLPTDASFALTAAKTFTVQNTLTLSGTDGSTLAIGTGGTLGTAAYTAATAYAAALSGTINEIAYFDSATTIASLAVATYPSLTELSYVKGVTSAIQTQINGKAASTHASQHAVGGADAVFPADPNADKFLKWNNTSNALEWADATGASGITRTVESKATDFTAGATASTDYVYFLTGTTTCTLPTAVGNSNRYTIKSISGTTTVACNGAETIDGTATISIANEDSVDLISDNTEWKVV